jgi:hypothetical protein
MSIKNEYQQHNFLSNTGFGNVSPTEKVDITGNTNITGSYKVNGTDVLSGSTLGSGVTSSSLTTVGTLSSLSVSGNLNVNTNTLFVDSVNNFVGIGTSNPIQRLNVSNGNVLIQRNWNNDLGPIMFIRGENNVSGQTEGIVRPTVLRVDGLRQGSGTGNVKVTTINSRIRNGTDIQNEECFHIRCQNTDFTGTDIETEPFCVDANGNVGIGTSNPQSMLHIFSDIRREPMGLFESNGDVSLRLLGGGGESYIEFVNTFTDVNGWNVGLDDTTRLDFSYGPLGTANPTTRAMSILTNGNVGIGTSNPSTLLHILGNSSTGTIPIFRLDDSHGGSFNIVSQIPGLELISRGMNTTNKYTPAIKFMSSDPDFTTQNPKFLAGIVGRAEQAYTNDLTGRMGIDFLTTDTNPGADSVPETRMTINGSGNVGIGLTNTIGKLDIFTGLSGPSFNPATQATGSISFGNSSTPNTLPTISGKSSTSSGLAIIGSNEDTSTSAGLIFDVRKNDNTDYSTLTNPAFRFTRFNNNLLTILRNGKIGIGTTNPTENLQVVGNMQVGDSIVISQGGRMRIRSTINDHLVMVNTGQRAYSLGIDGTTFKIDDIDDNTNRLSIISTGNVGIGSTNPIDKLEIVEGKLRIDSLNSGDGGVEVFNNNTYNLYLHGNGGSGTVQGKALVNFHHFSKGSINGLSTEIPFENATPTGQLGFIENGLTGWVGNFVLRSKATSAKDAPLIDRLRINGTTGNVGIGTTNPGASLHVYSSSGVVGVRVQSGTDDEGWRIDQGTNERSFSIVEAGIANRMVINKGGNVGIGTTNPIAKLEVSGTVRANEFQVGNRVVINQNLDNDQGRIGLLSSSEHTLLLHSIGNVEIAIDSNNNRTDRTFIISNNAEGGGNQLVRVQENGNVGIGTTNPEQLLHVNGNSKLGNIEIYNDTVTGLNRNTRIFMREDDTGNYGFSILYRGENTTAPNGVQRDTFSILRHDNNAEGTPTLSILRSNGNVGIGTDNPGTRLHVAGNLRVGNAVLPQPDGTAPLYPARAWVSFNGTITTNNILASANVSSVTRISTGVYEINFTTNMPSENYVLTGVTGNGSTRVNQAISTGLKEVNKVRVFNADLFTNSAINAIDIQISVLA